MALEQVTIDALINGEKIKADEYEKKENPAKPKEIVGYASVNSREDAIKAIDAADEAFQSWSETDVEERVERMERAIEKVKEKSDEINALLTKEHGKPTYDSEGELYVTLAWMEYATKIAKDTLADEVTEDEDGKTILQHDAMGVVSAISPWNYPLALSTIKIAPALLAGNTMVLKPSPFAPLAVSRVTEIIANEFPKGVLNFVHGDTDVGEELTSNPKVAKIAFTGGTETAKHIMKAASDTIKNMTLELGGNDPAVILNSFDVNDEAAMRRLVISNFLTAGQICMIAKRIYVDKEIYDEFVEKYLEAANKWLRIGDPTDENVTVGPMNNVPQKEYVEELVKGAEEKGATVTKVGQILDEDVFNTGYFLHPTVVTDVAHEDPIVKEEQFGPTVPIVAFDGDQEGIELANDSIYGLTSSVWGEEANATKVAKHIRAGVTMVNTAAVQGLDIRFPFGGVKQSGIGREYGEVGLLEYTEEHVINIPKEGELPNIPQ